MKRLAWFEMLLVVVVMAVYLNAAFSDAHNFPNRWFTRDDAYYYFKVAQNISEGRGSTFDGINPTNGYHPLWLAVCIPIFALARFDLILPLRILLVVMGGLSAATAILLYRLIGGTLSRPIGALAAIWWVFDLYILDTVYQYGLESGLAAFTLALLLRLLAGFERRWRSDPPSLQRIAALAAVATLVLFSRLDMVFLTLVIGVWVVFRGSPSRYFVPLDLLAGATAALMAFVLRVGLPAYYQYADAALAMAGLTVIVRVPLNYFLGLNQPPRAATTGRTLLAALAAVSVGTILIAGGMLLLQQLEWMPSFPRSTLLIEWGLSLLLIMLLRLAARGFASEGAALKTIAPLQTFREQWRGWLREGAVYYGVLGGALGLYMLWNKLAFGAASPVSGQIKRWWGSLPARVYGGPARTWAAFFGLDAETDFNAWHPVTTMLKSWNDGLSVSPNVDLRYAGLLVLLILGCVAVLLSRPRRSLRALTQLGLTPLFVGSALQILSYNSTGYASIKEWYWVGELIFLVLAASLVLDSILRPLRGVPFFRPAAWAAVALIGLLMGQTFVQTVAARMPRDAHSAGKPLMDVLPLLEGGTEEGALIGMTGGGNVGYFIEGRTIINMDGLINSTEYFQALQAGRADEYLAAMGLDYVFANPEILERPPYNWQVADRYQPVGAYGRKVLLRVPAASGVP